MEMADLRRSVITILLLLATATAVSSSVNQSDAFTPTHPGRFAKMHHHHLHLHLHRHRDLDLDLDLDLHRMHHLHLGLLLHPRVFIERAAPVSFYPCSPINSTMAPECFWPRIDRPDFVRDDWRITAIARPRVFFAPRIYHNATHIWWPQYKRREHSCEWGVTGTAIDGTSRWPVIQPQAPLVFLAHSSRNVSHARIRAFPIALDSDMAVQTNKKFNGKKLSKSYYSCQGGPPYKSISAGEQKHQKKTMDQVIHKQMY